ncbi:MAG TPA: alpha/beta fold hydrolase [Thermoanaerobaculaceae bacterium]|nr:alpha/beta fold hydrolase [Thermoanaerobaculaceae bacterium]
MAWVLVLVGVLLAYQAGVIVLMALAWRTARVGPRRTPADLGVGFSTVRIPTLRNRRLHGWWIPGGEGRRPTVVLVHGWNRNAERTLPYVEILHPAGYHLLAFDARHHGASDPDGHGSMKKFSEDIRSAIDFLAGRADVDGGRIAVVGLSIGGSAAIHAAAHDRRIRAVVTVGSFAHPREAIVQAGLGSPLLAPAIPLALRFLEWRIGARLDELAPERHAGRVAGRLLLVHGEDDRTVPVEHVARLLGAARVNAEAWRIAGRGHSDCHQDPQFAGRVRAFLAGALERSGSLDTGAGAAEPRPGTDPRLPSRQLHP